MAKVALVRKDYKDVIDNGLLIQDSNLPIFGPTNFARGYYQGAEFSLNTFYKTGWNGFATVTISEARPTAKGAFSDLPAFLDSDQRTQITAGVSHTWDNGIVAAADIFYGSGFPQEALPLYNAAGIDPYGLKGARFGRFLTNLSFNYFPKKEDNSSGPEFGGGVQVLNLFDQRTVINFLSDFSGTRFSPERRVILNGMLRF